MAWTHTLIELARVIGATPPGCDAPFDSVSTDTRTLLPGAVFFGLTGAKFDGNRFVPEAFAKGALAAVTTRPQEGGVCLVVDDPQCALQQFAAYHRSQYSIPVIGLTGSCGKTTAKDLMAAVLSTRYRVVKTQGNLNNEVGCPLSLLQMDHATEAAVIEMGASHPGNIAHLCSLAMPTEGAITMIGPAHLEGLGTIEDVARTKGELVQALPQDGVFYVNADDPRCVRLGDAYSGEKVTFGSRGDVVLQSCRFASSGELVLHIAPVGTLQLPIACRAHATNVLLAIAVGLRHGIRAFEQPLRNAYAQSSRFKLLKIGPLEVIDDTYNANPASVAAALEALAERPGPALRMAALGDMLELGPASAELHRALGEQAGRLGIHCVFALGEFAHEVVNGAKSCGVARAEVLDSHGAVCDAAVAASGGAAAMLLVKGSRGMQMEKVIAALSERFA